MVDVALASSSRELLSFRDLATEYEASLPPNLRHAEFETERARVSEVYSPPDAAFVASLAGEACGCVAMRLHDASTAVVKKLYVKPGSRLHGAARALMEALIALARRRGFRRLVLDTHREQLPQAYQLYLRLGFTPCEPCYAVTYAAPAFMEMEL